MELLETNKKLNHQNEMSNDCLSQPSQGPLPSASSITPSWRESQAAVVAVASLAVFIDMILYGVLIIIQPKIIKECGMSEKYMDYWQLILFCAHSAGSLIFTPLFGKLSDLYLNRKVPMLMGLGSIIASTLILAHVRVYWILVVARFLQGVSAAATWVVGFAMVADAYVDERGLGAAVGIVFGAHTVGNFVGPVLGGFMAETFGLWSPFWLCIVLTMFDLLARLMIKPREPLPCVNKLGFMEIVGCKNVQLCIVGILIYASAFTSIEMFTAQWLESSKWNYTVSQASLVFMCIIIPNALSSLICGKLADSISMVKMMSVGLLVHGLSMALIPLAYNVYSLIIFCFLFGSTSPLWSTPLAPYLADIVKDLNGNAYGQVYAVLSATYCLGSIIGPIFIGVVKSNFSFFAAMSILSVLSVTFAPIFYSLTTFIPKCSHQIL